MVVVDAGLSLIRPSGRDPSADELAQRRLKADLIVESWATAGIDALALGGGDWKLGTDFVRALVDEHELPVLAANLTCDGTAPYPGHAVIERGGYRVGFVGVTSGEVEGCEVGDAGAAIRREVDGLPEVDITIGLLPARDDRELGVWTQGGLPLDVILDARGRHGGATPEQRGDSWLFGAGSRGKHVGVLQLTRVDGASGWAPDNRGEAASKQLETSRVRVKSVESRLAQIGDSDAAARKRLEAQKVAYDKRIAELEARVAAASEGGTHRLSVFEVALSREVADQPETLGRVEAAKEKMTKASGADPRRFVPRIISEGPYAGGAVCITCHRAEHAQWSRTGHARAWAALVAEERALDDDCWSCHVTGHGTEGGPPDPKGSGPWRDVQCEACHGPSRAHAADPTGAAVQPVRDPAKEVCTDCHDGEQDGGRFDWQTYRPKVVHGSGTVPTKAPEPEPE